MSTTTKKITMENLDLSTTERLVLGEDSPFAVPLGSRPNQIGRIWGVCQCGGGGTPNARGLNMHRWVEQYGWAKFFQLTAAAVKEMGITMGVSIHNIMGNQKDVDMFVDDPLLAIPSRSIREAAFNEIRAGFTDFRRAVGFLPAYYCGGLYLPVWASLSDAEMAVRIRDCLGFVPPETLILIDGAASTDPTIAAISHRFAHILAEEGYRVGPEPIPVMESDWRNGADTTLILGKQVFDIEAGRSWDVKDGKKVRINYASFDEINGEVIVAMIEAGYKLGDVIEMLRRGVHVGINAFGGGWTPPGMKVKLRAPDLEAIARGDWLGVESR